MKERIKNLLVAGAKQSEVASIVGCSPSYVAQLLKDEAFRKEVEDAAIANASAKTEEAHLTDRYELAEQKILSRIEDSLSNAELPQLVRALEVVGKRGDDRKKRHLPATQTSPSNPYGGANVTINQHITNIGLPDHILRQSKPVVTLNEQSEIIAINDKPLAPLSSDGVKNLFAKLKDPAHADKAALTDNSASEVAEKAQLSFDKNKSALEQLDF